MAPGDSAETVVFGLHAVEALLKSAADAVRGLLVDDRRRDARLQRLVAQAQRLGVPVHPQSRDALDRLAAGGRHQGIVARVTKAPALRGEGELAPLVAAAKAPLLLVLDGVQDPHNLGACLRTACGAGVDAVVIPADRAVGLTPVVRKVACGAAEVVPVVQVTNLVRALGGLKELGVWVVGTAGEASKALYDTDLTGPIALVMGAEERGMRRLTRESCDFTVSIPLQGPVASLNVSVAAGIALFEALRQRRRAPSPEPSVEAGGLRP